MSETPYSNRELDMKLNNLEKLMKEIGENLSQGIARVEASLLQSTENVDVAKRQIGVLETSEENRRGANRVITYIAVPFTMLLIGYLSWMGIEIMSIKSTLQIVTPAESTAIQDAVAKALLPYSKL